MSSKLIFIAGLITTDHIMLKTGENWKYLGSIGGGSAANVYFALKSYDVPVKLIGAVGNKKPNILKVALKDINSNSRNHIFISKTSETREYYHIIEKKNNHWKHQFSSKSPITNSNQLYSVQFRKSYFEDDFKKSIKDCIFFYMDRISKGLLDFAELADKEEIPLIFDFGTISTRYFKKNLIIKAIQLAKVIQIPQKIYNFLKKNLNFEKFQEINSNILIWIITAGKNPILVYHKNFGELKISTPNVKNILDTGGAGDAFMAMFIKQYYDLYKEKKSIEKLNKQEFIKFLQNCIKNAKKACLFIGSRTYIYDFLKKKNNTNEVNKNLLNPIENENYFERSLNLIENFGKEIKEISESIQSKQNDKNFKLKKGKSIFESNILNIPISINYALNYFDKNIINFDISNLGSVLIMIGSGASYTVAIAMQQIFNPLNEKFSVYAYTPYEYILKINKSYPVCLISYSGTNADIKGCYKKALVNNCKNILLVTGSTNSLLFNKLNKTNNGIALPVITPKKERGFVGVYSMIASLCILTKFFNRVNWDYENSEFISQKNLEILIESNFKKINKEFREKLISFDKINDKFHLIALGTNWSKPVLIDFESKIIECNLGTIEISELKNYTHGRYINLYKNPKNKIIIIFQTPETLKLSNFLENKLSEISIVFKLKTKFNNFKGMLDLFIQMLIFINELGKYYDQDPSKPGFPNKAKGLYNWDGFY